MLDEHGQPQSSTDFAQNLARIRDQAPSELVFVIGGADGLAPVVLARADIHAELWQNGLAAYVGSCDVN